LDGAYGKIAQKKLSLRCEGWQELEKLTCRKPGYNYEGKLCTDPPENLTYDEKTLLGDWEDEVDSIPDCNKESFLRKIRSDRGKKYAAAPSTDFGRLGYVGKGYFIVSMDGVRFSVFQHRVMLDQGRNSKYAVCNVVCRFVLQKIYKMSQEEVLQVLFDLLKHAGPRELGEFEGKRILPSTEDYEISCVLDMFHRKHIPTYIFSEFKKSSST
jgi:hypothetical protein